MNKLTCVEHKRRVMVLRHSVVHRSDDSWCCGTASETAWLTIGGQHYRPWDVHAGGLKRLNPDPGGFGGVRASGVSR